MFMRLTFHRKGSKANTFTDVYYYETQLQDCCTYNWDNNGVNVKDNYEIVLQLSFTCMRGNNNRVREVRGEVITCI